MAALQGSFAEIPPQDHQVQMIPTETPKPDMASNTMLTPFTQEDRPGKSFEALQPSYDKIPDAPPDRDNSTPRYGSLSTVNVERVEMYREGGYHPVLLGDTLDNGRYTIIHKLRFGGLATSWLARDTKEEKYVTIKIVLADMSEETVNGDLKILQCLKEAAAHGVGTKYFDLPLIQFWITGPNGRHICIVSEVAGPSLNQRTRKPAQLDVNCAHRAALQTTQCLAYLHSPGVGIVHGDLTTSNILLELRSLDHLSQEEIIALLGQPLKELVYSYDNEELGPSAPIFLYEPADLTRLSSYFTGNIKVIDFGMSFLLEKSPEGLGTPACFKSPELLRDNKASRASDIWALACTIFEMRAGHGIFEVHFGLDSSVIWQMRQLLGPLPPSEAYEEAVEEDSDEAGERAEPTLRARIDEIIEGGGLNEKQIGVIERLGSCWLLWPVRYTLQWLGMLARNGSGGNGPKIPEHEADLLFDLLSKAFRYDTEERLTADEMLRHPWFSMY